MSEFVCFYLQNVIQQMLAVQPELLNDHAIPPAHQSTIDSLSTLKLTEDHLGKNDLLARLNNIHRELLFLSRCQH